MRYNSAYRGFSLDITMDCIITEILSEPFQMDGKWWRNIKWLGWGCRGRCNISFENKSKAYACRVKDRFKK
jgi:hypothetical protein